MRKNRVWGFSEKRPAISRLMENRHFIEQELILKAFAWNYETMFIKSRNTLKEIVIILVYCTLKISKTVRVSDPLPSHTESTLNWHWMRSSGRRADVTHSVLGENWQNRSQIARYFRSWLYKPDSYISAYLERALKSFMVMTVPHD